MFATEAGQPALRDAAAGVCSTFHDHPQIDSESPRFFRSDELHMLFGHVSRIDDAEAAADVEGSVPRYIAECRERHPHIPGFRSPLAHGLEEARAKTPSAMFGQDIQFFKVGSATEIKHQRESHAMAAGRHRHPESTQPLRSVEVVARRDTAECFGGQSGFLEIVLEQGAGLPLDRRQEGRVFGHRKTNGIPVVSQARETISLG